MVVEGKATKALKFLIMFLLTHSLRFLCSSTSCSRILGGLGTLLPWWPIKAYRPCPTLIDRGGRYTRAGQPLDEIAFGRSNIDTENDDF